MSKALAALAEIEQYFLNRQDVVDGDYGVPEPNEEMRMLQEVEIVKTALSAGSISLKPDELEWLEYAIDHMIDDSEPEDKTCAVVIRGLLDRTGYVTHAAAPAPPTESEYLSGYDAGWHAALSTPTVPPPVFNQNAFGLACTVAWTELVQALRADGHDVKDNSGPTVRKWMEGIVRDTFAAQEKNHASPPT